MNTQTATTTEVLQQNVYQQRQVQADWSQYFNLLKKWEYHYRDRIDKIFLEAGRLSLPIDFGPFEDYFTGFNFQYTPFDNTGLDDLHGLHEVSDGRIHVYYAENCVRSRQRFTIAHELMHVYQHFDHEFLVDIESIRSTNIQKRLIERIADKSAGYYLAPLPLLKAEVKNTCNAIQLASLFGMSPKAISICLQDYGLCP